MNQISDKIECQLQQCLGKVDQWATENGFEF